MSFQVTTAMVDMFSANVFHLSQQQMSRFRPFVRNENQNAETAFYDRIGTREARRKEGRHSDVVYVDTPHSRRAVTMIDFYDADMVDQEDKLRTIMNIENEYTQAIAMGLARQVDREIIEGALGDSRGGKKGTEIVPLPDTQKVAAFVATETSGSKLNIPTLRAVRLKFKQNEAIQDYQTLVFACAAQQIDDLLAATEVTSGDYNTIRALVNGEVDTYMGFKFVRSELIPFNSAAVTYDDSDGTVGSGGGTIAVGEGRRCFAFTAGEAILMANPKYVVGRIDELPGKHYAHQVYGCFTMGTTRMEEVKVVEVICKEV
jgi:hypothetical protein